MPEAAVKVLLTSDEVFRLHQKIRWAALSSDNGEVVFSQMRPGVESYTSNEEDRAFMELGPLFMTSLAERLTPLEKAGRVESVVVNLEKDAVLLTKVENGYLAVSADRTDAAEVFPGVALIVKERFAKRTG